MRRTAHRQARHFFALVLSLSFAWAFQEWPVLVAKQHIKEMAAGVGTLAITLLTVTCQSIEMTNPVYSLSSE